MDTTPKDNRKLALEALTRRFAMAKAEILQQQEKKELGLKRGSETEVANLAEQTSNARGPGTSGAAVRKDVQAVDPACTGISHPIHENLLAATSEITNKKGTRVERFYHELVEKGDSAQKYMHGSRSLKIHAMIHLDNLPQGRTGFDRSLSMARRTHSKRSKIHMSMKKHKKCGSFDLSQDLRRFHLFLPMHEMWKKYVMELLRTSGKNQLAQCLLTADLHGSIVQVADCKVTSFAGANGIMIRETSRTFGIITRDDKFRVVPKKGSIFQFQADCWKITLHGEELAGGGRKKEK